MFLPEGYVLTARKGCFSFLNPDNMRHIEWFRAEEFENDIGHYGSFIGTYRVCKRLRLLNLGNASDRQVILHGTTLTERDLNPDTQYSGHVSNLNVHTAISASPILQQYAGTIISKLHTDVELLEYLEGPEEVVIFMDRTRNNIVLTSVQKDEPEQNAESDFRQP